MVLKILDEVSKLHPFIGGPLPYCVQMCKEVLTLLKLTVPLLAFRAVLALDQKRRESHGKIVILLDEMSEMMLALQPYVLVLDVISDNPLMHY